VGKAKDTASTPCLLLYIAVISSCKNYLRWVHDAHFQFTKVTTADQHITKAYQP